MELDRLSDTVSEVGDRLSLRQSHRGENSHIEVHWKQAHIDEL